jgi:hypothetical protein
LENYEKAVLTLLRSNLQDERILPEIRVSGGMQPVFDCAMAIWPQKGAKSIKTKLQGL